MTPRPEAVPRYPLEWPLGWKRTTSFQRRHDQFRYEKRPINMAQAVRRLEEQFERLRVRDAVLSTNVTLTLTGLPRGAERPSDPGVAVYFTFKGRATVLACDTYYRVAGNIAALAAHLEHLRAIERYGVGTIEQALAGYKALPADTAADWRAVLGFAKDSRPTLDQVDTAYKGLARTKHPDAGGSDVEMAHLNRARDYALADLEG